MRKLRKRTPAKTSSTKDLIIATPRAQLNEEARRLITESLSYNSLRAIRADLRVFTKAGGRLPASETSVANFLSSQLASKKPSTIERYASSIHTWHHLRGHPSPVHTVSVQQLLKGMRRTEDTRPKGAPPLRYTELKTLIDAVPGAPLVAARDRAMISLGFHGAFRRSELVALLIEDVEFLEVGMLVTLRRSKTNQTGRLEQKPIQRLKNPEYCPVALVERWIKLLGRQKGALFPSLNAQGELATKAMRTETFYRRLRAALNAAGLDAAGYSPHSLRAGYVTEAYRRGASLLEIKRVSGHRHQPTLERYIRLAPFENEQSLFD